MFEGTKAVIRCRNSKKERKYNGKKTNDKKINNIYKTLHRKLKIEQHDHTNNR